MAPEPENGSEPFLWQPGTVGDRKARALGAHLGCCGNNEWRGRLCQYHQGWADGWDERDEEER